jgi:SAM-dependent methyltransferase
MKNCLNLGSGKVIRNSTAEENWVNLDSIKLDGVNKVHNLDKYPWPFKNDTFDRIDAFMVLEHISDIVRAMEEIHRISKQDAEIVIKVPFFPGLNAINDPTHKNFLNYYSFDYFTDNHSYSYYSKARFKITKKYIRFSWNPLLNLMSIPINLFPRVYSRYLAFILPSNELFVRMRVVK